jgi:mono/diheme cytochrome c family protein
MEKGRTLRRWTGVIAVSALLLVFGAAVYGIEQADDKETMRRADLIVIDTMRSFGPLERPPVVYRHDKHTEALQKQGKDCAACHLKNDKQQLSLKYQRLKDGDRDTTMQVYHDNCIACHTEIQASGEKSGPITCGECHVKSPDVVSSWQPIGMDKSLHYRHVKSQEQGKKCAQCHHEYDKKTEKLVYVEGKESDCRYCHKEKTEDKVIAFSLAAHEQCIACHRETLAKKKEAGPVECAGCHSAEKQLEIAVVENVPRMKRNQPDVVFVKTGAKSSLTPEDALQTKAVPFNHREHEIYNDTCRVCHHASLASCAECHTVNGIKEGNFVQLQQAMHEVRAEASCVGCHAQQQVDQSCAGCHAFIRKGLRNETDICRSCHMDGAPSGSEITGKPEEAMLATMLLNSRPKVTGTLPIEDIPEKVVLNKLEKKYQPVEMPHRKMVQSLVKRIGDNKLAAYFHQSPGTICQGCHHNSPLSKKPPQCGSCHGKPFNDKELNTPGLYGAYHIQCMGCHREMGLEKPVGCTECHKEK